MYILVHMLEFLGFQIYGDFLKTFWASVPASFWVSTLLQVDLYFILYLYLHSYFILGCALVFVCGRVPRIIHVYACDECLY